MRNLLKAIFKTGSASLISITLGVFSMKILAVVLGPSGIGLLSLIRQILSTASTAGTIGGQQALVQGLASRKDAQRDKYLKTVFWVFIIGSTFITIAFLLFAPWIAKIVFRTNDTQTIDLVRWMALPAVLMVINYYLTSVLNGFRAIGRLAIGQIIVSIITLLLTYPISKLVNSGNIIAFIWMISASTLGGTIFYIIIAYKEKWLNPLILNFKPQLDKEAFKHFSSIASTTLFTGLITTGTLLIIRTIIIQYEGLKGAGIFDVAWTLSMTYVMLLLSSFGTYYLPTLSRINNPQTRNSLMQDLCRLSIMLITPLITTVIVLKPLMITILYSTEFTPALRIIRWMLIGDYFKTFSWILAMPMIAYADMKTFLWSEVAWNIGFLSLSVIAILFINEVQAVGISFASLYAIYFIYTIYYAYTKHDVILTTNIIFHWTVGLVFICIVSWQTWYDTTINWASASIWIVIAVGLSWTNLTKNEQSTLKKGISAVINPKFDRSH